MTAGDDDTWNPFDDPSGETAHAPTESVQGLGADLTEAEWAALLAAAAGERLREIEIDRLVKLKLATRSQDGDPELTQLGRDTAQARRRK